MKGLGSWNQFLKISSYVKTCSASFPGAESASLSTLNSPQGVSKISSCNSPGRWQMPFLLLFSSIAQSCPTLCDPINHSTPGFPVHHQLPELTQTHVHQVGDAIQLSHPLSSPSPPALNLAQRQGLFQWVNSSHEVAKVLEFQLQHQPFQWTPRTDLL